MDNDQTDSNEGELITCTADQGFAEWLSQAKGSLAITTYQAGKLVFVSWDGKQISILPRQFEKPMGCAVDGNRMALATRYQLWIMHNSAILAHEYLENEPGRYDALFLPRASYCTNDLNIHDVAFVKDGGVCVVASRFSCLAGLSHEHNFVPRWQPPFISEVVPEDRCHLNGLAVVNGRPKYVTALGESNVVGGWREHKATGGILIDVESGEILHRGLSMPHSPRWYDGHIWFLNSGCGELRVFDPQQGRSNLVCALPAYLRGLAFVGPYALVGMCQVREKHIFGGLPVQQRYSRLLCGVAIIDLRTGQQVGQFEFTSGCQEIYDVQFLAGIMRPMVLNHDSEAAHQAVTAPQFAYWLRPSAMIQD